MGNSKLYIIGNGFDLWHGIPSKYADFKAYVGQHDRQLLRTVDDYLPAGDNWSDLESALADLDIDSIIDDLGQFMPSYGADDWSDAGHHDFQYEVDRVVQRLSKGLRQQFSAWVHQLPIPSPATAQRRLSTLDPTSRFLSFNYTPTLQQLYGVPGDQVLHIHGSTDRPDSDLVLGHAWNPSTRPSLNDRHDIEDLDVRLMEANDILDGYFSKTFKPSSRLIKSINPSGQSSLMLTRCMCLGTHCQPWMHHTSKHLSLCQPSRRPNGWWSAAMKERRHQKRRF